MSGDIFYAYCTAGLAIMHSLFGFGGQSTTGPSTGSVSDSLLRRL